MRFLFLLSLIAVLVTGCASSDKPTADTTEPAPVSTIPWNRPASWEGGGALGGAMGGR